MITASAALAAWSDVLQTVFGPTLGNAIFNYPYAYEVAMAGVLAVIGVTYLVGAARNRRIATAWYDACLPTFRANFAYLGDGSMTLLRDGEADYLVYGSGRVKCEKMIVRLALKERHILPLAIKDFFMVAHDRVTFDLALDPKLSENFVLAIINRSVLDLVLAQRPEIAALAKPQPQSHLPPTTYALYAESTDLLHHFFTLDVRVARFLAHAQVQRRLESLIITDFPRKRLTLTYRLRLAGKDAYVADPATDGAWSLHRTLASLAIWLADYVTQIEVRPEVKARLRRKRDEYATKLAEEEEKKAEAERAAAAEGQEELAAVRTPPMSPAAQRRLDEKKARKEQKKAAKSGRMRIGPM
ncbi:Coiled-coil domain-containing protein 47 [Allomyces javanicus]|nr:Coiled-coil domain-containing protein 47 [Allomyces javanicus]